MAVTQIGRITSPMMAMAKAATASTQLFKTIDAEFLDISGLKAPEVQANANIVFKNVSFTYPSRPNVQILQKLTTTFEAGKVTAIVGPSGSGKSTIVGLIERWYDLKQSFPSRTCKGDGDVYIEAEKAEISKSNEMGAIKIGNTNIHDIDAKWLRS